MKTLMAVCIASLLSPSFTFAEQETIPEIVRRQRGSVRFRTQREFSPVGLVELAKESDRIARVVVQAATSHLSEDQRSIYTDYTLQVLDQFGSRTPPVAGETTIVRKPGGMVKVDDHEISSLEGDFPPFEIGEEYILFLKFDSDIKRYIVPYGAQGAFRIIAGNVEQVSRDTGTWNSERGAVGVLEFMQELSSTVAAKP